MSAATNNITVTGYEDRIVESDLKKYTGSADGDESFGTIRTRIRAQGDTFTATTDVSIVSDTATGEDEINELCEDVCAHFQRVKTELAALAG